LVNWVVSMRSTVVASPWKAGMTSKGGAVREVGMAVAGESLPLPSGSSARYSAPTTVLIRIDAFVSSPSRTPFLTRNLTTTWSLSSPTLVTVPTFTPATRTSSVFLRLADSVKFAR
jgi:hypothetical protein